MQQCPRCGRQYPPNAVMCPKCKIAFMQQQGNMQYQQPPVVIKRGLSWWQVLLIVIGAIIIIPAIIGGMTSGDDDSKEVLKTVTSQNDITPPKSSTPATPPNSTVASIGETLDYNGLKITLNSANNYVDTSEYPMDKPDAGKIFVMLNFTAENASAESAHVNMFYEESYCDDTAIDPETIMFGVNGETIWGDIATGKKRVGYICYEVPSDWTKLEFYYTPELFTDKQMKFEISADQVK